MQARITLLEQQARALERQAEALTGQLHAVHQQHGHLLHAHEMLKRSLSWRITAPMRKVLDLVRSGR
jgi:prefoldin subunit 5